MKRFLTFDGINGELEDHNTIEEAREWLEERFLEKDHVTGKGEYHPDLTDCYIFELKEIVDYDLIDTMIEEGSGEEVEIWKHKFVEIEYNDKDKQK